MKHLVLLFALAVAAPALASGDSEKGSGDPKAECVSGCQDDASSCQKICRQQAGQMVGACTKACKDEQRACEKDCKSPGSSDSEAAQ